MNNLKFDAESYLKTGSNELRVLEYQTVGMSFGINILKVNKIVSEMKDFIHIPETHPAVNGIFKDRDRLVPVVDLAQFFGIASEESKCKKIIITEFFGILTGFCVEKIDWIHHFKWEDVIDTQNVFANIDHRYVIGIVKPTEEKMIQLLDYESILLDLCPYLKEKTNISYEGEANFNQKKILIAEDSPSVRAMLINELTQLGCEVVEASDGVQGWKLFQKNNFDLVICDVEMPQMDGLALTLNIRQSERPSTPVIVYSSIGDVGMKARASFLKADAHITKLNLELLMETVEKLMKGEKIANNFTEEEVSEDKPLETIPIE